MYKDLAINKDLLQLRVQLRDHENDSDDVVPEFSEPVDLQQVSVEHKVAKPVDFAGSPYEEMYDEWMIRNRKLPLQWKTRPHLNYLSSIYENHWIRIAKEKRIIAQNLELSTR